MCGRFTLTVDPAELQDAFQNYNFPDQFAPRFNIAPTQPVLAIPNNGKNTADFFLWGLIPSWSKDPAIANKLINARGETVAEKPSFRDAWKKAQHCIIPAQAIYEPDWRSGRAVSTRIERSDGRPMGIAGLWSWWRAPDGNPLFSFTMLTVNADQHDFMRNFHKPEDEKRMVVILPEGSFGDWLNAAATDSGEFLNCFPADLLQATGVRMQKPSTTKPEAKSKAASATKTKIPPDSNLSLF